MISALAAILLAQTSISIHRGSPQRVDSASQAKLETQRDSISRRINSDSVRKARSAWRALRALPVTPAVIATAFGDARARDLLLRAREARLRQDSSLTGYEADSYQRMSIGMGFGRIGRDRLLLRNERASHVMWSRGNGAIVEVKGQRSVFPILAGVGGGEIEMGGISQVPYYPGRETLWIGSRLTRSDVSGNDIVHPLATGAEAYYRYDSGDSVSFQLPGGRRIEIKELRIRPRQPKWNVAVGSLWFDATTADLVRAVYRLSTPMDIMTVGKETADDPDDGMPGWVRPFLSPMKGQLSAITVEYGLHESRYWLPRTQTVEGDVQISFMRVPFRMEQRYTYGDVNGLVVMPRITISPGDTASDSLSRAARVAKRRSECKDGSERARLERRDEVDLRVLVRIPCDTIALARSSELPKSIYDDGEELFGRGERDALVQQALTLGAQADFQPQKPTLRYGLSLTRFNRIEGLSTGIGADQILGGGYTAHGLFRIGFADRAPNAELGLERSNGRRSIVGAAYRRLAAANDWGDPLGFSSSVSALIFGRDDGFYYRTLGAELKLVSEAHNFGEWRLFAEHQSDARVRTEFAFAHPGGVRGKLANIDAVDGNVLGLSTLQHRSAGLNPRGFRMLSDFRAEAAAGAFDYARGFLQTTASHPLTSFLDGALTLGAGVSGGSLPIQKKFFMGGVGSVRGQRAGAAIGDAFWMSSLELGNSSVGVRKIVFADLGWAGSRRDFAHPGRPLSGVGVGASFLDGLFRIDVSKGIYPEKKIRANLYVEARF